jgi:hypothetical protein
MDVVRSMLVDKVTSCFSDMGASLAQVKGERMRLMSDDHYLEGWVETCGVKLSAAERSAWRRVCYLARSSCSLFHHAKIPLVLSSSRILSTASGKDRKNFVRGQEKGCAAGAAKIGLGSRTH